MECESLLCTQGYAIIDFETMTPINEIQKIVESNFPCFPLELHLNKLDDSEYLQLIKKTKDKIVESHLIRKLLLTNSAIWRSILGPDIDVQQDIHLRVSRPSVESDFIDWHRDTFYGNSFWEMNLWFPIFPLEPKSGLLLIEGSHLMESKNIQVVKPKDAFRSKIIKGSLENQLGYAYLPKMDDVILNRETSTIKLLSPKLGQAILFFGHMAHRSQNLSNTTRITVDIRLKNMFAPTQTKEGYYQPLMRSVVTKCIEKMSIIN